MSSLGDAREFLLALLDQDRSQEARIDRRVADPGHDVRNAADVVQVAVGDDDSADSVAALLKVFGVRKDVVYPGVFSSLNWKPMSMTMMSSPNSMAVMLRPTSSTPPKGTMRIESGARAGTCRLRAGRPVCRGAAALGSGGLRTDYIHARAGYVLCRQGLILYREAHVGLVLPASKRLLPLPPKCDRARNCWRPSAEWSFARAVAQDDTVAVLRHRTRRRRLCAGVPGIICGWHTLGRDCARPIDAVSTSSWSIVCFPYSWNLNAFHTLLVAMYHGISERKLGAGAVWKNGTLLGLWAPHI